MGKLKTYRYTGHAKTNPTRFKAKSKTALLKRLRKERQVFVRGLTTIDFEEV